MGSAFVWALIRHLVGALGGYLVAQGYLTEEELNLLSGEAVLGALMTLGSILASFIEKRRR